jgi:K+-sensing histidine kinase KdpD
MTTNTELQKAERRAKLLQAANKVGKEVTSILNIDELLPAMVNIICDTYGFYYSGVYLVDESGKVAVLATGHGEPGKAMMAEKRKLEVGGHSMIGWATGHRIARIALNVGEDAEFLRNPHLPKTKSEMALPIVIGNKVLGAVTVQSPEENAFSDDDILTLQTMADHLAVAINNAQLVKEIEKANAALLRTKTYEALTEATTQAIHWMGNKALPMTTALERIKADAQSGKVDLEDIDLLNESVKQIIDVQQNLLGPVRDSKPRPVLLADVIQAAAYHAGTASSLIAWDVDPSAPLAQADSAQLVRAVGNLLRNASEAGAHKIEISIKAEGKDQVRVTIKDDGKGIASGMIDQIWSAFTTTKPGHSGLGLPSALLVINQLHGTIQLTSEEGRGTTVMISLPAATDASAIETTKKLNVLLIDDADAWSNAAMTALQNAGQTVTRALTIQGKPDLVLIDEALADAKADEALAQAKALGVKAIVLSAAPQVANVTRFMRAGANDVALKPYTSGEFGALL